MISIKIDLNGETLTISAQHNAETSEDKDGYVRRERRYGSFARSFDVSNINTEAIKAAYNNGVLELICPGRRRRSLRRARSNCSKANHTAPAARCGGRGLFCRVFLVKVSVFSPKSNGIPGYFPRCKPLHSPQICVIQ